MLCDPKDCTGGQTCAQCCPNDSITMVPDLEGFRVSKIDETRCTKCGLCETVCPQIVQRRLVPGEPIWQYDLTQRAVRTTAFQISIPISLLWQIVFLP